MNMKKDPEKLYGPREFALLGGALVMGIAVFLGTRFRQSGRLSAVDVFACVAAVILSVVVMAVIVRTANRKD